MIIMIDDDVEDIGDVENILLVVGGVNATAVTADDNDFTFAFVDVVGDIDDDVDVFIAVIFVGVDDFNGDFNVDNGGVVVVVVVINLEILL